MTSNKPVRKTVQAESFHIHINPAIEEARNKIMAGISMPTLQKSILTTGKLPAELSTAVQGLAELAAQLVVARNEELKERPVKKIPATSGAVVYRTKYKGSSCGEYNTYWNAFLGLVGVCSDWEACSYEFWRDFYKSGDSENPYTDCAPTD